MKAALARCRKFGTHRTMGRTERNLLSGVLCLLLMIATCFLCGEENEPALLTLTNGNFLRANRMIYSSDRLWTEGDVWLGWRDGLILADFLEISRNGADGYGQQIRCGVDGYLLRAATMEHSDGKIAFSRGEVFWGEPGPFTWHLSAKHITARPGHRLYLDRPSLFLGSHRLLTLAHCSLPLGKNPIHLRVHAGMRRDFGVFIKGEASFAFQDRLWLGSLVEAYSRRGILLGPTLHYQKMSSIGWEGELSLRSGYIRDLGKPSLDLLGRRVGPNRFFLEGMCRGTLAHWQVWSEWRCWSDSEMMRDFRPECFALFPDAVLALRRGGSSTVLTALLRLQSDDFQTVVRRLPEVHWEILSRRLGSSGFSTGGFSDLVLLRREDGLEQLRCSIFWKLEAPPLRLLGFATLRPHLALRTTSHSLRGDTALRVAGELGLDLHGEIFGFVPTQKGAALRHRCSPILQYRRLIRGGGRMLEIVEDRGEDNGLPLPIDLADSRCTDLIQELHLLRIGWHNSFFRNGCHEWGCCTIYRDIGLSGQHAPAHSHNFHANAAIFPSSCLSLSFRGCFYPATHRWEEFYATVQFRDGMFWKLSLDGVHHHGRTKQWRLRHHLRANSRLQLDSFFSYDVRRRRPIEQCYQFRRRLDHSWALEGSITIHGRNSRGHRYQLGVGLTTAF